jgi:hypothetical protein
MDEIAAYKNSKLFSSIVTDTSFPLTINERGVNIVLHDGNNKVNTC